MNAATKLLRVGLIGYGFVGKGFHAPLIGATEGMRLTAVASSDEAKVRADLPDVEVFADPEAMIDSGSIDLVVIASPNTTHFRLADLAIAARLHVVVDKPFTPTFAEARTLIARAEQQSVMIAVFQNRRWDSDYLAVREVIESGILGRIVHFESHIDRFRPAVRDRWREQGLPASGLWFDLGPHLVDQALQLFGLPDSIQASFAAQRDDARIEDWAHVIMAYGGLRVILHCSLVAMGTARFIVHGTAGSAFKTEADHQEAQLLAGVVPGTSDWGSDPDPLVLIDAAGKRSERPASGDQRRFYANVVEHLAGRGANPVPGVQAIAVSAVLEAAATAAQTGQSTPINLSDAEREAWSWSMRK